MGVTSGSAATANASGAPVYGIASTPTDNISWFIGWQGDVAIAVMANGTDPAAVAGRFFHNAHSTS
ncbi:hypothetical protein [Thermocatellispora tengchongensis]